MNKKTYSQPKEAVSHEWHLVDAKDQIVGRLATQIATKLIGKHKPTYSAHIDGGDNVVVINAAQVVVTRTKDQKKLYVSHSHQPGGLKVKTFSELKEQNPTELVRHAVYSMLPKNRLRTGRMNRLKVYADDQHPHGTHFAK